jgi:NAD(P)-dependent dehydrogenase (short-subunit alcohol dehydrogenase family)
MSIYSFSNQTVLITGAAGALGSVVARKFHRNGARIVLVDHARDRLSELFSTIEQDETVMLAQSVDVTNVEDMVRTATQAQQKFGGIDVLVNVAGGYRAGQRVHETPIETWEFMLGLNARSVLVSSKAVVPHMLRAGAGKIINIASRAALGGEALNGAYSASKAAVVRLTESMAAELKDDNINVNCVMPGTIDTPANRESMPGANTSRWVEPDALADVILFLASDGARAINGASIPVYGKG